MMFPFSVFVQREGWVANQFLGPMQIFCKIDFLKYDIELPEAFLEMRNKSSEP